MLSGLPLSAATREVITTWNNTVGSVWPGMKRTVNCNRFPFRFSENPYL